MVRDKLDQLKSEINRYIGIPYFINLGQHKNIGDNALVGKGSAHEIALKTIELANTENIKLTNLTIQQIYYFQKKHHLGIDCSGLVCQLLNFYGNLISQSPDLNPRQINADILTSSPLSRPIYLADIKTADLIRQRQGKHVIFIVEKIDDTIFYVQSKQSQNMVKYGQVQINDPDFFKDGIFRLSVFT